MKIRQADSEVIGTSAIDLFASGMGAFMLIALIFMVMFASTPKKEVPDTQSGQPCPECPEVPEPVPCPEVPEPVPCPEVPEPVPCPEVPEPVPCPEVPEAVPCPECPECPEVLPCPEPIASSEPAPEPPLPPPPPPEPEPDPVPAPALNTQLPDTDLVFVVDATGSMLYEIDALKRELHIVVEVLERMMPSVGVGIVTFNDRLQFPMARHFAVRRLTGDDGAMREIQRFMRSIAINDARGPNPDVPEAVLGALRVATTSTFRPEVKNRVVIVITDALAYDDEIEASLRLARSFSAVEGQRVSAVHIRQHKPAEGYLKRLAEAGGGEFVPDRGSILANVLLGLLGKPEDQQT